MKEDGPKVSMITTPLLRGQSQYLGGETSPQTKKIYLIPGHAHRVLVIDPANDHHDTDETSENKEHTTQTNDETYHIGPAFPGEFKWLRGIYVPSNGMIYGLPCHSDAVLKIHPLTEEVTLLPLPPDATASNASNTSNASADNEGMPWKYHGGALCPLDNCIYAIPQYAHRVLKLDPSTDTLSYVGPHLPGRYKWYGGLVGSDGAVYGIPQNSDRVLRIDPLCRSLPGQQVVSLHGGELGLELGGHKWHGGASIFGGALMFGIPCNSDKILKVEAGFPEPTITLIGMDEPQGAVIRSGRHRKDDKYKFLGAVVHESQDSNDDIQHGAMFCIPSGSERVLQIGVIKKKKTEMVQDDASSLSSSSSSSSSCKYTFETHVKEVGPNLRDAQLETFWQNKWQNGFTSKVDGCLYAIPLNGERVLRIDPQHGPDDDGGGVTVETIGDPVPGLNKWEGCAVSMDGVAYCVPNNYKGILKIVPANYPKQKSNACTKMNGDSCNIPNNTNQTMDVSTTSIETHNEVSPIHKHLSLKSDSKCVKDIDDANTTIDGNEKTGSEDVSTQTLPKTTTEILYKTGIPTLRSAAHTVKYSARRAKGREKDKPFGGKKNQKNGSSKQQQCANDDSTSTSSHDHDATKEFCSCLPLTVRTEHVFRYDAETYDLQGAVIRMLSRADSTIVGGWDVPNNGFGKKRLEDLRLPVNTLSRKVYGGRCEDAQKYLSHRIASDEEFLGEFDKFVMGVILPWLKSLLVESGVIESKEGGSNDVSSGVGSHSHHGCETTFYYQRPPTLRLQPGPSNAYVKAHRDADYGHQDGELNFWVPLVDLEKAGKTYLWIESSPDSGDYHPMIVPFGEIASFHGSFCRHYVPANPSIYTRASIDFRIGIEGKFDPAWQMIGTRADHSRRSVRF